MTLNYTNLFIIGNYIKTETIQTKLMILISDKLKGKLDAV